MSVGRWLIVLGVICCVLPVRAQERWETSIIGGGGPANLPAASVDVGEGQRLTVGPGGRLAFSSVSTFRFRYHTVDAAGILSRLPVRVSAISTGLLTPALDAAGNVYVISGPGEILRFAPDGSSTSIDLGALGPRIFPFVLANDAQGNLYIGGGGIASVWRFDPEAPALQRLVGCDLNDLLPCTQLEADGVPALEALIFDSLIDLAVDDAGNVYLALGRFQSTTANRIVRVDAVTGLLTRVAGADSGGILDDGIPALDAAINTPGIDVDGAGNLFLADRIRDSIRRVDALDGTIDTLARADDPGSEVLEEVSDVAVAADGSLYATAETGVVRLVAGVPGSFTGDGTVSLDYDGLPIDSIDLARSIVKVSEDGRVVVYDALTFRFYEMDREANLIRTIAGSGNLSTSGFDLSTLGGDPLQLDLGVRDFALRDGRIWIQVAPEASRLALVSIDIDTGASEAVVEFEIDFPRFAPGGLEIAGDGTAFVFDDQEIQRLDLVTGVTEPFVGEGTRSARDGESVVDVRLDLILEDQVHFAPALGRLLFTEFDLFRVDESEGLVRRHLGATSCRAGGCEGVYWNDGNLSNRAASVDSDEVGNIYLGDRFGLNLRRLEPRNGRVRILAGEGTGLPDDPDQELLPFAGVLSIAVEDQTRVLYSTYDGFLVEAGAPGVPPQAVAAATVVGSCGPGRGATVELIGEDSLDPDAIDAPNRGIAVYDWYIGEERIAIGPRAEVELAPGAHTIRLGVFDADGLQDATTLQVTVEPGPDTDADGVDDCVDNCLIAPNGDQADVNGNGIGDACDTCPQDRDADGVCDDVDNCAEVPNAMQGDLDGDGVGDACDVCPDVFNPEQVESGGCLETADGGTCLPARLTGPGTRGSVQVTERASEIPDVRLPLEIAPCDGGTFGVIVNGVTVQEIQLDPGSCDCDEVPPLVVDLPADSLRDVWNGFGVNAVGIELVSGSIRVGRLRLQAEFSSGTFEQIFYARDCAEFFGVRTGGIDPRIEVDTTSLAFEGQPSAALDLAPGDLRQTEICIDQATLGPRSRLLVATDRSELWEVGEDGDPSVRLGRLPGEIGEIAWHEATGRAVLLEGGGTERFRSGSQAIVFDPEDGRPLTSSFPVQHSRFDPFVVQTVGGVAERDGEMIARARATWFSFPLSEDQNSDIEIDMFGGVPRKVGSFEPQERSFDLVWRPGRENFDFLFPRDDESVFRRSDGSFFQTSFPHSGLAPGDDLRPLTIDPTTNTLFRILPELGTVEPLRDLDVPDPIVELMRIGPRGTRDCFTIDPGEATTLAINASCGAPTAQIATSTVAECDSGQGAAVLLDGTLSIDPNQPEGQFVGSTFEWFEDFGEPTEILLGTGSMLATTLPLGPHRVTLQLTNRFGESSLAEVELEVVDTLAPHVQLTVTPRELRPANRRLVTVQTTVAVTDRCADGPVPTWMLESVVSDEDAGDRPDVLGADIGLRDTQLQLRAERDPSGDGRRYTLTYVALDGSGNTSRQSIDVVVPLDSRLRPPLEIEGPGSGPVNLEREEASSNPDEQTRGTTRRRPRPTAGSEGSRGKRSGPTARGRKKSGSDG